MVVIGYLAAMNSPASLFCTTLGSATLLLFSAPAAQAQAVPNPGERIESLVTFGGDSDKTWGDDDYTQTFFFLMPEQQRLPVYIRVWDPDCGGQHDDLKGPASTTVSFSLYGGVGTFTGPQARAPRPTSPTPPGRLLQSHTFGSEAQYDGKWFTFGPLNPLEAEAAPEFRGRVFKVVARGLTGNDGNLYRYFFSTSPTENIAVEGGNAFTYEYGFRLPATNHKATVHLYPFVNDRVVSIKQNNFDMDKIAQIHVFSIAKNGHPAPVSGEGVWASSVLPIKKMEHGLSLDFRLTSVADKPNDLVFYVTDQYDTALPFFAIPLGGPPKYKYDVDMAVHP